MPEHQKIKNGGLDQYGTERFGRLIFATITKSVGLKGLPGQCTQADLLVVKLVTEMYLVNQHKLTAA